MKFKQKRNFFFPGNLSSPFKSHFLLVLQPSRWWEGKRSCWKVDPRQGTLKGPESCLGGAEIELSSRGKPDDAEGKKLRKKLVWKLWKLERPLCVKEHWEPKTCQFGFKLTSNQSTLRRKKKHDSLLKVGNRSVCIKAQCYPFPFQSFFLPTLWLTSQLGNWSRNNKFGLVTSSV